MAQNLSDAAHVLAQTGEPDDSYFNTERLKTGLGARAARGGAVTIASQAFKFFTGLGTTMVLGRLLTPADYGLIGMVAVVTGFVSMFKDLGLSAATVQREEITSAQVSTLFWVNVALSIGVGLLTLALAPAVAWFYGKPQLTPITAVYGLGFLFATIAAGLATAMSTWLAILIVTIGLFLVAAILGLIARNRIQKGTPPIPEQAILEAKLTTEAIKSDGD